MNTEGGRISHLIDNARRCAIEENLAKARAYQGLNSCVSCKPNNINNTSVRTINRSCYNYVKPPVGPESVRIAKIIQDTLNKEINPMDPTTRFVDYAPRPTIPVCPAIDPELFNSDLPKISRCQLPNTPLNPILPV
jgi:hypothetical protein